MTIGHDNATQLFGALSALLRAGRSAGHRHASELGAAGTSLGLLKTLQCGDARPSDLAGLLHVGPSVVSRAIVPLEREGLIERKPDPADARACRLSLTALGRERLAALQEGYVDRVRSRLAAWSDEDAVTATAVVSALADALGESEEFAGDQARLARSLLPTSVDGDAESTHSYTLATTRTDQN